MDDDGEEHDEDDQADQPDQQVQSDMLERRQEAVVLHDLCEIIEADKGAALGEGEEERIERRQDPEAQQQDRIEAR